MRSLENDRNVIIKPADKGSSIVVWDRLDYLAEAEKQLSDSKTYKEVQWSEEDQIKLVEKSNSMFEELKKKTVITEKEKNYFKFNFKKATNVGKLYLLPKIHKRLSNVTGRPVISNCGTPTEKVSEYLDHHLQPVMKEGKSYIKDTADFLDKLKDLGEIPEGAILVTADVVGLYPSIPHTEGLEVLRKQYDKFLHKKVPTEDIIKMADFVLKNNCFEFNSKVFQQISGTAIGTKFAAPYACICMDYIETEFLKTQSIKPWVWKRFIDDVFFIWTDSEENLEKILKKLNGFHPSIKFTFEKSKMKVNFLDVVIKIKNGRLSTDLYSKPVDSHQYFHYNSFHTKQIKNLSFTVKL